MPPGIKNDVYDSERDILFLEELLSNDSLSLPENESFHFDVPLSPRPPAKPSDNDKTEPDTRILTVKVMGDISDHYVRIPILLPTQPTLASNEEKSPHLLSHQGFKTFQLSFKSLMMIYGGDNPTLDVSLQKLIIQLEILGETISQEDINLKFLRSLPSEWKTHTLIWRNKADLEEQSLDDLFKNLKIYEAEVKVSVVPNVSDASTKALIFTLPNVDSLSDAEMDLKWQMAMLKMRARRFLQKIGRNLDANETDAIGFDMSKVECYNCHKRGYFSRECRSPGDNKNNDTFRRTADEEPTNYALLAYASSDSSSSLGIDNENENVFEEDIKLLKLDIMLRDNALVKLRKKFEKAEKAKNERDDLKLTSEKFQTFLKNLSKLLESQVINKISLGYDSQVCNSQVFDCEKYDDSVPNSLVNDKYKLGEGYHDVPPPYTRTFMPPKPDLVFNDALNASETVTNVDKVDSSSNKSSKDMSKTLRPDAHVTTVKVNKVNVIQGIKGNADKASANWKLEFNLFSVSQTCEKKNSVLLIDTECVVLSSDYKLPDENHVLLRVPRENNMYNDDLKNVVPSGDLTCLFAKDTLDESNLWVYFIEGLGHNLFSVGQLCYSDIKVAFRRNACFIRNLEGVDLLNGDRSTNLYTINHHEMASASPICLMACASSTKSWLWHQRLSHLNFDTIYDLAKNDLVSGLLKFRYHKEHLCLSCEPRKSKRASHPPKPVPNSRQSVGISHQLFSIRPPQQNGVMERKNRTLVEAARTMLIFSHASLFLWAEAIATVCFTQNRSFIHRRFNKTPYELINGRKLDISFLHVFKALCYPKNDREDIRNLGAKGDIGFFFGYSADSCAYRIYNRRTKKIMETINVTFDELSAMAFE
nr:integrase, catalytic region, zinc finger, CCHC-type, peptidase aspartic, catalytic [Tanacetum cinerariifolium]